jgi:hypothetical protein
MAFKSHVTINAVTAVRGGPRERAPVCPGRNWPVGTLRFDRRFDLPGSRIGQERNGDEKMADVIHDTYPYPGLGEAGC